LQKYTKALSAALRERGGAKRRQVSSITKILQSKIIFENWPPQKFTSSSTHAMQNNLAIQPYEANGKIQEKIVHLSLSQLVATKKLIQNP
jgi:hypothetical protein